MRKTTLLYKITTVIVVACLSTLQGCEKKTAQDILNGLVTAANETVIDATTEQQLQDYFDKQFPKVSPPHMLLELKIDASPAAIQVGNKKINGNVRISGSSAIVIENPPEPPAVTKTSCEMVAAFVLATASKQLFKSKVQLTKGQCAAFTAKNIENFLDKWLAEREKQMRKEHQKLQGGAVVATNTAIILFAVKK